MPRGGVSEWLIVITWLHSGDPEWICDGLWLGGPFFGVWRIFRSGACTIIAFAGEPQERQQRQVASPKMHKRGRSAFRLSFFRAGPSLDSASSLAFHVVGFVSAMRPKGGQADRRSRSTAASLFRDAGSTPPRTKAQGAASGDAKSKRDISALQFIVLLGVHRLAWLCIMLLEDHRTVCTLGLDSMGYSYASRHTLSASMDITSDLQSGRAPVIGGL